MNHHRNCHASATRVLVLLSLLALGASASVTVQAADKEVTIAYQDMMVPWRYAQD
jgi:taurine transport system substrate-binding protein